MASSPTGFGAGSPSPATVTTNRRSWCNEDVRHYVFELGVGGAFIALSLAPWVPRDAPFLERDPALSHPLVSSTVPTTINIVISIVAPAVIMLGLILVGLLREKASGWGSSSERRQWALTAIVWTGLAFFLCIAMASLATNATKNYVGRKRPNFYGKCDYAGYFNSNQTLYLEATAPGAVGSLARCTATAKDLADSQRSFPSGHATTAFSGLGFLAFALRSALCVAEGVWFSPLAMLAGSPLALASWIAVTRVVDGYHNEDDIMVGAMIGLLSAYLTWSHLRANAAQRDAHGLLVRGPDRRGERDAQGSSFKSRTAAPPFPCADPAQHMPPSRA